jgi:hypothetical protein
VSSATLTPRQSQITARKAELSPIPEVLNSSSKQLSVSKRFNELRLDSNSKTVKSALSTPSKSKLAMTPLTKSMHQLNLRSSLKKQGESSGDEEQINTFQVQPKRLRFLSESKSEKSEGKFNF